MIAARIPQSHDTWRVQRFLVEKSPGFLSTDVGAGILCP